MQNLAARQNYTLEEYAELEKSSEEKLEFYNGNVWSMAGASPNHEAIVANVIASLKWTLRGRECRVFSSNLRIKVPEYPPYRYPDVTAVCEQAIYEEFFGLQMLVNPALIVEVLSNSTEAFDMNEKFTYYKSIESFKEYLLITQTQPHVVLYTKQDEKLWLYREFNDLNDKIRLTSLDCEISLKEIYETIEFKAKEPRIFPFGFTDSK
jgi:Uma2 family endonuclease